MMRESFKAGSHIVVWLSYITFAIFVFGYDVNLKGFIAETSISVGISAIIFYSHLYILPQSFGKRKYPLYSVALIGLYFLNFGLRYLFAFYLYRFLFGKESSVVDYSMVKLYLVFSWQWLPFIFFSAGYWFYSRKVNTERENEKLRLENSIIRAQINPHFLFNTFNSLKQEAEDVLPEVANGIAAVTNIMRGAIAEPGPDGMVALEDEISVIESLILIYRRRFPSMNLTYNKNIDFPEHVRIIPHILVVFVENLFKHGSYKSDAGNTIHLQLKRGNLYLEVYNKKSDRIKEKSFKIGTNYIRKTLESFYKQNYTLDVNETQTDYHVSLSIKNISHALVYEMYNN